jgi:hypothetical protein
MHQSKAIDDAITSLQFLRLKLPANPYDGDPLPSSTDLCSMTRTLDGITESLAFFSEYLSWRGGAGCGDHGEVKAATKATARAKKVRRALGYTNP